MPNFVKFKDAFENVYSTLFKSLRDSGSIWAGLADSACASLSEDYFYHSYDKLLNRKASAWFDDDPSTFLSKVVAGCLARFSKGWDEVFKAFYSTAYKPLEDFGYKETRTPNLSQSVASKITTTSKGAEYGYNSEEPVPTSEAESTTSSLANENIVSNTGYETIEKEGINGSHTKQSLLIEEIDARAYDYFKSVFEDIDKLICLNIY